MSIVRTISEGFAWNAAATAVGKIVGFVNLFLIFSHLTIYEYGVTELTLSIVSLFGLFLLPGLSSIIAADLGVERAKKNFSGMRMIFREFFSVTVSLGVLAWAILFFGSSIVAHLTGNDLIDRLFNIASFLLITSPLRTASSVLATSAVRFADQSFFPVVEEIAKGVLLAISFFVFNMTTDGLLLSAVGAQIVAIILFAPRSLSAYREFNMAPLIHERPLWNIIGEHRKWGIVAAYIGTAQSSIRLFVLKLFLGTEAVGIYAFASGLFGQLAGLLPLGPVVGPLFPRYIDKPLEFARLLRASIRLQLVIALALVVGSIALAPIFVEVFFEQYSSAVLIFILMVPALLPQSAIAIYTPVFRALKEQRTQLSSAVFKFIIDVLVLPPLVIIAGLPGAGMHSLIVAGASAIERSIRLRRLFPELSFSRNDIFHLDPLERKMIETLVARMRGMVRMHKEIL
ncbi:MAG: oligosaccharide flippase family protein [Minisyncoccia bacterium]